MTKICTKCGQEYPATMEYFYQGRNCKDELRSDCKKCSCAAAATWYKKNSKHKLKYVQEYYQKNSEKRRKYNREYGKTLRGYISSLVRGINTRCTNKNCLAYENYGGRGIKCYFTSQELYNWLIIKNIDPRGKEIHRIDNNGDYTFGNITFLGRNEHAKLHRAMKI